MGGMIYDLRFWENKEHTVVVPSLPIGLLTLAATMKLKGRECCCTPGRAIYPDVVSGFQQRTNTSCQLALPTRGFTAVVSVFRGTPPTKPLNCKIRFLIFGDAVSHL